MRTLPLAVLFLLIAPFAAGCLGDDPVEATSTEPDVAVSAEAAGARPGAAPSAPKSAFEADGQTAHPLALDTNPAREPVVLDLSGEFGPADCRAFNMGQTEDVLRQASYHRRTWDLSEHLRVGDVFSYKITLSFTNTDASWGEIRPMYGIGNTLVSHDEPTGQQREPVLLQWTGQSYRVSEEDPAFLRIQCYYGVLREPIPYSLRVEFTFAEGALPAEAPLRVPVPEGATRLMVRGLALDPREGVTSHFRLFAPDDSLVCECALLSSEETSIVDLPAPGDYVLLVDHTENGFVTAALDAPAQEPMEALSVEWSMLPVLTSAGESGVDALVELQLDRVPLFMHAYVLSPEGEHAGFGRGTSLSIANTRGEVLRYAWPGHLTEPAPDGDGMMWIGWAPGDWESYVDHHAYAPGQHVAHVKADFLRGTLHLVMRQYVR